jgi:uncharacterized protein (UPF0276 family)
MRAVLNPDETVVTLVRIVAENLASWGGAALHELHKAREEPEFLGRFVEFRSGRSSIE